MAERRMLTKTVINSDKFIDMPLTSQALYVHLLMNGDDDGFISNPRRIQRAIGASDDDMRILMAKKYILAFETGVMVISHWRLHNYIQKDRYKPTVYQEERSRLLDARDNSYILDTETPGNERSAEAAGISKKPEEKLLPFDPYMDTDCIPFASGMDTDCEHDVYVIDTETPDFVSELEADCIQNVYGLEADCIHTVHSPDTGGVQGPVPTDMETPVDPKSENPANHCKHWENQPCIQSVSKMDTQVRLGKVSIGEVSIGQDSEGKERSGKDRKEQKEKDKKEKDPDSASVPEALPSPKTKHKYGEYRNVLLTDEEYEKLSYEYPDYRERIEDLSNYLASKGTKYKSHYATIRTWARKEKKDLHVTAGEKRQQAFNEMAMDWVRGG